MKKCPYCGGDEDQCDYERETDICGQMTMSRPNPFMPTKDEMTAAAAVMNEHGIAINLPWDGDLDDLERERFKALMDAITAVLKIRLS